MRSTNNHWLAIRDLLVIGLLLAATNLLLNRSDFGWFLVNPTPWLLPAALIGARYGFVPGLASGVVVSAMIGVANSFISDEPVGEVFRASAYYYLSMVVVGAVAGEIGSVLGQRKANQTSSSHRLEDENLRLRSQLHLVDDARHQLQQQLALYNAPLCALDSELRTLLARPLAEFEDQLLRLLHRNTGITSGGIYSAVGGQLNRTAAIHPTAPLKQSLPQHATPLAAQAISTGAPASVPDVSDLSTRQPFLAALPWSDHDGKTSVLMIQDMPLESFNLQNLARIQIILSWATAMNVLKQSFRRHGPARRVVSTEDFKIFLNEAHRAERAHALPSTMIRLDLKARDDLASVLEKLPATAIATRLNEGSSLAVLLPFSGEQEVDIYLGEVRTAHPSVSARHTLVAGTSTPEHLWQQLTASLVISHLASTL